MIPGQFPPGDGDTEPGRDIVEAISGGFAMLCDLPQCPPPEHPVLRPYAAPICRFTSMVNLNNRQELPDAPIMHIVDGKAVEPRDYNWLERIVRFLLRPFVEAWHHRDLIGAILR